MVTSLIKIMFAVFNEGLYAFTSLFTQDLKKRQTIHQFLKFALIGVVNTIIDFGIYTYLTRYTAFFDYHRPTKYIANCISFFVGTTFSFYANRTWTFEQKEKPTMGEATKFYSTTLSGLMVNNVILFVLSSLFGINDLVAKIFSTVFSTIWNFLFKKFWVFAPEKTAAEPGIQSQSSHHQNEKPQKISPQGLVS